MQDRYGVTLHSERDDFPLYVSAMLAAHATGFTTVLDHADGILAAQLTSSGQERIDRSVRLLAARDVAWQIMTALAAAAQKAGLASLPTGAGAVWRLVCVYEDGIGPKVYPALAAPGGQQGATAVHPQDRSTHQRRPRRPGRTTHQPHLRPRGPAATAYRPSRPASVGTPCSSCARTVTAAIRAISARSADPARRRDHTPTAPRSLMISSAPGM